MIPRRCSSCIHGHRLLHVAAEARDEVEEELQELLVREERLEEVERQLAVPVVHDSWYAAARGMDWGMVTPLHGSPRSPRRALARPPRAAAAAPVVVVRAREAVAPDERRRRRRGHRDGRAAGAPRRAAHGRLLALRLQPPRARPALPDGPCLRGDGPAQRGPLARRAPPDDALRRRRRVVRREDPRPASRTRRRRRGSRSSSRGWGPAGSRTRGGRTPWSSRWRSSSSSPSVSRGRAPHGSRASRSSRRFSSRRTSEPRRPPRASWSRRSSSRAVSGGASLALRPRAPFGVSPRRALGAAAPRAGARDGGAPRQPDAPLAVLPLARRPAHVRGGVRAARARAGVDSDRPRDGDRPVDDRPPRRRRRASSRSSSSRCCRSLSRRRGGGGTTTRRRSRGWRSRQARRRSSRPCRIVGEVFDYLLAFASAVSFAGWTALALVATRPLEERGRGRAVGIGCAVVAVLCAISNARGLVQQQPIPSRRRRASDVHGCAEVAPRGGGDPEAARPPCGGRAVGARGGRAPRARARRDRLRGRGGLDGHVRPQPPRDGRRGRRRVVRRGGTGAAHEAARRSRGRRSSTRGRCAAPADFFRARRRPRTRGGRRAGTASCERNRFHVGWTRSFGAQPLPPYAAA